MILELFVCLAKLNINSKIMKEAQLHEQGVPADSTLKMRFRVSKSVDFEVLPGLTNALLDGKRPDEAIKVLPDSRQRLNAEAASVVVDPIQNELLLGKAYSDWGHVSDAVSVYDQLISTHPDDLAKGIILKKNDRPGDAERMFIQARFFAPEKAKALVDRYARK